MEEKRIRAEAPDDSPAAARENMEKYPKTEGDEPNDEALIPAEPPENDPVTDPAPDRKRRS